MKKTLIALAVAASAAVSGSAMAWSNGDFNGSVDIGGTVTPPPNSPWQWKMGAPITGLDTSWDKLSASNEATFNINTAKPLVMGKLETPTIGGPNLAPQVTWQDAKGQKITPVFDNTGNGSRLSLNAAVMDKAGNNELGSAVLHIHAYGLAAKYNVANNTGLNYQPIRSPNVGNVGYGMLSGEMAGILQSADQTLTAINALATEEIFTQAMKQGAKPKDQAVSMTFTSPEKKNTAALVAGFEPGDSVVVTFNQRPTSTTEWKIPVGVTVVHQ
ncbi:TPA: hypothetical protein SO392_004468 [Escherichia coli]|nr:hypothetical protein [Escherichia coli]HEK5779508.1 hypothetical protein [Escherichia coli]HEK5784477.1 hypothetical protein [Escherichia coli]HEK5888654.1 hypothetical protein [Escherichia coli]